MVPGYRVHQNYKAWLRDDFNYRCAYCLWREQFETERDLTFVVEHFRPKARPDFAHLETDYENVYYVCWRCNSAKGSAWPTQEEQAAGKRFVDPCIDVLADHLAWNGERVVGRTPAGTWTVRALRLDAGRSDKWRQLGRRLRYLRETFRYIDAALNKARGRRKREELRELVDAVASEVHGYLGPPTESPDLRAMRPPDGNTRPEGVERSFHATGQWPPDGMVGPDEFLGSSE